MSNITKISITMNTPSDSVLQLGEIDCGDCGHCCQNGSGFMQPQEVPQIAKAMGYKTKEFMDRFLEPITMFNTTMYRPKLMREDGKPHGACVFYNDAEKCSIHGIKPLHCRVGTCEDHGEHISEWFILNNFVNPDDPQSIREWASKLKTHPTIPGGELHELVQDPDKLKSILEYEDLKEGDKK